MINVTTLILKLSIFQFLYDDVPRSTSYGVYISQLIRFARASSIVADFNTCNKFLTQKLFKQGYRYDKLRKTFSKFYRRYYDLISKFQVGLKSLLRPPVKYFTDRSKAVLLLWIFYVFVLSYVCYVFVCVC